MDEGREERGKEEWFIEVLCFGCDDVQVCIHIYVSVYMLVKKPER